MKKHIMIFPLLIVAALTSCDSYVTPDPKAHKNDSIKSVLYINEYDQFGNKGQYNLPEQKLGTKYWVVVNSTSNTNDYSDRLE